MTWKDLTLEQRSNLMRIYLENGISSLDAMKEHYNNYATGGELSNEPNDNPPNKKWYDNYYSWRRKVSKHKDLDIKHDDDYNYRKYYKENQNDAWSMLDRESDAHFPDTYKYPSHPTFSNQSMYSQQWQQDHNVKNWIDAPIGGDWGTDEHGSPVFYHSYYTAATPEKIQRTADYLKRNDPGVKAVFEPITTNIVLPQVNITDNPEITEQQARMINGGMYMPKAIQSKIDEVNQYYKDLATINNQAFPNLKQATYEAFNSQIWDLENQARVGYDKTTDRWVAHKSPEGGAETIGGGIKLGKTNPKWDKIYRKQGYLTTAQVKEAMKENADKAYNAARISYTKAYGSKEWEQLDPKLRALLMDISYNTGNVSGFKGLLQAIHDKDIDAVKKQHYRSYKDNKGKIRPVKNRNEYFDSVIEANPNLFASGGSLDHITNLGQWKYPGEVTTVPSNSITMKGVNYPVLGISNTGDIKLMQPNKDYKFSGSYVTEYPFQKGGKLLNLDAISGADAQNVYGPIEFLTDYVNSKAFEEKAPNKEYINKARTNIKNFEGIVRPSNDFGFSGWWHKHSPGYYGPRNNDNKIYFPEENLFYAAYPDNYSIKLPHTYEDVLSHEFGHQIDPMESMPLYSGAEELIYKNAPQNYNELFYNKIQGKQFNAHDWSHTENYADLQNLRWLLYKNGIFDARGGEIFNKKHLEEAKNKGLRKKSRLMQTYDDATLINMLNTIAYNTLSEDLNIA